MMQLIIWSSIALYGALVLAVVLRFVRQRRIGMRLLWPPSVSQRQMERWGVRFLERRMGWEMSSIASQANITLLRGGKNDQELFVVFLRDGAFFGRLLSLVGRFGTHVLRLSVIVLYVRPTEAMVKLAFEQMVSVVHFTDLPKFEDPESARLPGLLMVKESERKIRTLQAP